MMRVKLQKAYNPTRPTPITVMDTKASSSVLQPKQPMPTLNCFKL